MSSRSTTICPGTSFDHGIFEEIASNVSRITGVQLGARQTTMVETRVRKRILDLKLRNDLEYADYFRQHKEAEMGHLISLLTTHHTFFFREFTHFEALEKSVLPRLIATARAQGKRKLRLWSAACSRGQEVYSLAMFLNFHLARLAPDFTYEILGTDVDAESVKIAQNGVFHRKELKEVPLSLLGTHWARGTGEISDYVKAKPSIKDSCQFAVANLIDLSRSLLSSEFDIIFCRNVFIYFNAEQIKAITQNLLKTLQPEGTLFVGISESLGGLNLPITSQGPSIYSKFEAKVVPIRAAPPAKSPAPLRVLCVDDSPSVITLLKKILTADQGFEVIATAANGLEAAQKLKTWQVDVVTLDIHMPEQTGLEYLAKNFGPNHPPVVMITSVSREDSALAFQCLKSGASDFVEKPALNNLAERAEEIRTKLLCAVQSRATPKARDLSLDQAFQTKPVIKNPDKAIRAIVAPYSSWDKLAAFLKEVGNNQPATLIFVEGSKNVLGEYAKALTQKAGVAVEIFEGTAPPLRAGKIYVADFATTFEPIMAQASSKNASILVYGGVSQHGATKITRIQRAQLLVEDTGSNDSPGRKALIEKATDLVPATSFAYISSLFLSLS